MQVANGKNYTADRRQNKQEILNHNNTKNKQPIEEILQGEISLLTPKLKNKFLTLDN